MNGLNLWSRKEEFALNFNILQVLVVNIKWYIELIVEIPAYLHAKDLWLLS